MPDAQQRADGSWMPAVVWQPGPSGGRKPGLRDSDKYCIALRDLGKLETFACQRGLQWLASVQNADGGWGCGLKPPEVAGDGTSSVEETSLAVEALLASGPPGRFRTRRLMRGLDWLVDGRPAGSTPQ